MRVLFLGNNRVGWEVIRWLRSREEQIVGVVLHPKDRRQYGEEILDAAGLEPQHVFEADHLRSSDALERIRALEPDIAISAFFGYILQRDLLEMMPQGAVNLHAAFLPYNRGTYPNVWSIVEGAPAGVTLHYMDEGTDTGDIIARKEVPVEPVDTGESLYRKLEAACMDLFREAWPLVRAGRTPRTPQREDEGTAHRRRDVERIDAIDLDGRYTARELIDVIRARTFPPHRGAYFEEDGRRVYLRLQLSYEDELDREGQAGGSDDGGPQAGG